MRLKLILGAVVALCPLVVSVAAVETRSYDLRYHAALDPAAGIARVEIALSGEQALPSRLELHVDPERYSGFEADGKLDVEDDLVVWRPGESGGELRYRFKIDNVRGSRMYDSRITEDWAIFRGDRMIPPISVTAPKSAASEATLKFDLPADWSIVTQYEADGDGVMKIENPGRRFDRPKGWMLAGRLGTRAEMITGIKTVVAAPTDEGARRQDTLAFLMWNLPHLAAVFPQFPKRLLIIRAGDPMFRGGLSGPASLFMHLDRPLISENRTSALLHELVHVAMGIRGDHESDWIVEGLAEYYSVQTLYRSGGIGQGRYEQAMESIRKWARRSPSLFAEHSNGPTTARAVLVFQAADAEIRKLTNNAASLDQVARKLAAKRGEVSLAHLQQLAQQVAGKPLQSLQREQLTKAVPGP